MQFTIIRPDGRREVRQYTPYAVKQAGPQEWHAIDRATAAYWPAIL